MKKHNEVDVNLPKTFRIETRFRQSGKLCDDIEDHSIEGKQLDLCETILSLVK